VGGSGGAGTGPASAAGATVPPVLRARDRWRTALADRLPPTLQGRWALDRRTGTVLAVSVLLAALLIGGWAVLRSRPHELSVARSRPAGADGAGPRALPGDSPNADGLPGIPLGAGGTGLGGTGDAAPGVGGGLGGASGGGGSGAGGGSGSGVVVDVEGRVARPGVRTLPAGSRVIDALTAAGGALPGTDLSALNQAQVLVDGEQVLVGVAPPPGSAGGGPVPGRGGKGKGRAGDGVAEPVHLNAAAVEDLEQLPGIGPALAQRIVDYRTAHGPFHSVEDLRQVSGFSGQRYETLAPQLAL
jgi:competence protein ComEA